jgi:hypothetical protein
VAAKWRGYPVSVLTGSANLGKYDIYRIYSEDEHTVLPRCRHGAADEFPGSGGTRGLLVWEVATRTSASSEVRQLFVCRWRPHLCVSHLLCTQCRVSGPCVELLQHGLALSL